MISWISQGKGIVINKENNNKQVFDNIVKGKYIYIFTNSGIALSKQFKNSVLDWIFFTDYFTLLAIDKIHLVEEWDNNFQLIYCKIKKVYKKIPCYVSLLDISAILTKSIQTRVVEKTDYFSNYHLMQTSLDWSEII